MASKFVILACLQALALQSALCQVILPQYQQVLSNPLIESVPNCGCGCNQILSLPQQIVQVPQQVLQVPTTVVQDTSVSNNLANALQLLVVSNLLSNTLPFNEAEVLYAPVVEQVVSPCANYVPQLVSGCGFGGISAPSCGCGGYSGQSCGCGGYSVPSCGCGGYSGPSCGCGGLSALSGLGIYGF